MNPSSQKNWDPSSKVVPQVNTLNPKATQFTVADFLTGVTKRPQKKYNLDDFLDVANEGEVSQAHQDEEHIAGPQRTDIIRNEDDDEIEQRQEDPDADEDLEEDDYGEDYFDNGEGDFDDYADVVDDDER